MKWHDKMSGGRRTNHTPPPVSTPNRVRFASDNFNYDLTLNKTAPYLHNPVANRGVVLGSGPMMFFVGTMGFAADGSLGMVAAERMMTRDQAPNNIIGG